MSVYSVFDGVVLVPGCRTNFNGVGDWIDPRFTVLISGGNTTDVVFAMLKARILPGVDGDYSFETNLAELGGSPPVKAIFHSEKEFFELLNRILFRQKVRHAGGAPEIKLKREPCYFFDVDLTAEEAEYLGWKPVQTKSPPESRRRAQS